MANAQTVRGNWNEIKGKVQEKWADVTGDELDMVKGKTDQIIGLIQRKTGVTREEIDKFMSSISESGATMIEQASETIRQCAESTAERVQEATGSARETAAEMTQKIGEQAAVGYEQAQEVVRRRPAESLAVCFGVGVLAGVVGGLLLRSR